VKACPRIADLDGGKEMPVRSPDARDEPPSSTKTQANVWSTFNKDQAAKWRKELESSKAAQKKAEKK
jgi:hypothetical protein